MPNPRQISKSELEELKASVDLVSLIRSRGVVLSSRGFSGSQGNQNSSHNSGQNSNHSPHSSKDLLGLCPFHADKTPSFVVTPHKGLWHCFGCGAGGTVLDFLMKSQGISVKHAIELLREAQRVGDSNILFSSKPIRGQGRLPQDEEKAELARTGQFIQRKTTKALPCPVSVSEGSSDSEILSQVFSYYRERLEKAPAAMDFLKQRGLMDQTATSLAHDPACLQMVDYFQIGFSDRTLGIRLPMRDRIEGKQIRKKLMELGIYRENGREHLLGCLCVPVFNEKNNICQAYGRKTGSPQRDSPAHLYLKGPHTSIFHPQGLIVARQEYEGHLIITEAIIDALSFFRYGYRNVVSSFGVEGIPKNFLERLLFHQIKRVLPAKVRRFSFSAVFEPKPRVASAEG